MESYLPAIQVLKDSYFVTFELCCLFMSVEANTASNLSAARLHEAQKNLASPELPQG
jgi:hypothetical protein